MNKILTGILAGLSVCTIALCSTGCDLVDELTDSINTIVNGVVTGGITDDTDKPDDGKTDEPDNKDDGGDTPTEEPNDETVMISFVLDGLTLECEQGMTWTEYSESAYNNSATLESGYVLTPCWIDGERIVFAFGDVVCYIIDATANDVITQDAWYSVDVLGETISFSLEYRKNGNVYYKTFSATNGMTWSEFVDSGYNDGTFYIIDETVYYTVDDTVDRVYGVNPNTFIQDEREYSNSNVSGGGNGNTSVT